MKYSTRKTVPTLEVDSKQSLFFLQLGTRVRERRASKPRYARNEDGSPSRKERKTRIQIKAAQEHFHLVLFTYAAREGPCVWTFKSNLVGILNLVNFDMYRKQSHTGFL